MSSDAGEKVCGCERWDAGHTEVHLDAHGQSACVDLLIAPVIEYLWSRGIQTAGSCQDTPDVDGTPTSSAYVSFYDFESLDLAVGALAWVAAEADLGEVFLRATQQPSPGRYYGPVGEDRAPKLISYDLPMWRVTYKNYWWVYLGMKRPLETTQKGFGSPALWLPAADVPTLAQALASVPVLPGSEMWPTSTEPTPAEMMFFIRAERG